MEFSMRTALFALALLLPAKAGLASHFAFLQDPEPFNFVILHVLGDEQAPVRIGRQFRANRQPTRLPSISQRPT
jgi:hypothetical protein